MTEAQGGFHPPCIAAGEPFKASRRAQADTGTLVSVLQEGKGPGREPRSSDRPDPFAMPYKANADLRHHIPWPKRRVTNWAAYDAALRRRGNLAVWFTEEAIESWRATPRTTPGGQPHYSALKGSLPRPEDSWPLAKAQSNVVV